MKEGTFLAYFVRKRLGMIALGLLVLVSVVCIAAPWIAPYGPNTLDLLHPLAGPSAAHLLGTGVLGRDELSQMLYGGRVTLLGVLTADTIYVLVGTTLGISAGYLGGVVENLVLRLADLAYSIPAVIILLVIVSIFPNNESAAMIGLGLLGAPGLARIVRSIAHAQREELYIKAARAAGLRPHIIMRRHVLPAIASTLIVQISLFSAGAVLLETGLSFLGFGVQGATWGGLIAEASQNLGTPWLLVPSGGLLISFVLSLGLLGDAARDALAEQRGASRRGVRHSLLAVTHANTPVSLQPQVRGALLSIQGLTATFPRGGSDAAVITDVSFEVMPGEALGLLGESGCGKTVTALAVMGLLRGGGQVISGSVQFEGTELIGVQRSTLREIRGGSIGFIAQDPISALDPCFTVGSQIVEVIRAHESCTLSAARSRVVGLLETVRLPDPTGTARLFPHELSGGMAQRVGIAAALACGPRLLIADEPTTALDVTVQAEILDLLRELQAEGMAVLLVTHDWGVVSDICSRALVMYAGQVVEEGTISALVSSPRHPYTEALLAASPHVATSGVPLAAIEGQVPPPEEWPVGCRFQNRCVYVQSDCVASPIELIDLPQQRLTRCIHSDALLKSITVRSVQ